MASGQVMNDSMNSHGTPHRGRGDGPSRLNGFEDVPRPFMIGVAGGTASGKVIYLPLKT